MFSILIILNAQSLFAPGEPSLLSETVITTQKMKVSIQKMKFPADLVTFTGDILNGKLYFLCSAVFSAIAAMEFFYNQQL